MQILKSFFYNLAVVTFALVLAKLIKDLELRWNIFQYDFLNGLMILGATLLIVGLIIRIYCAYIYYKNNMEVFAVNSQKRLIKDFPFNVTRNPLYVGLIMFAVGASLYMNSLVSLIGLIGGLFFCLCFL
jgi:protein-S-isoprenylcysteine O-methyltransferase Ste14